METKTDSVKLQELISQLKSYFESRDSRIRLELEPMNPRMRIYNGMINRLLDWNALGLSR